MKTIFSYAKSYKFLIFIAISLMLVELAVELIQPLLIAKIIDDGIRAEEIQVVWSWGGILLGLAAIAFIAGIVSSYVAAHVAQSFAFDLRQALFQRLQSFSLATFLRFPTAGLITRLTSDVTIVQNVMFMGLRIMLRAPLLVIGSLLLAFFVNVKLATMLVISAPFLAVFLIWMTRSGVTFFSGVQKRLDRVNRLIQENLQAVRLVKAYMRGDYEASRFAKVANALKVDIVHVMRRMELILPVLLLVMNGSLMAVLWFGSNEIQNGQVQVGEVVAVVNYALRMTGAFSMFSFLIVIFSRAKASAERMEEVLVVKNEEQEGTSHDELQPITGEIEFQNVSFCYPTAQEWTLKNISFRVKAGETLAILGATGSGKSTLLQLIPRLFEPTQGTILLDGIDTKKWSFQQLRQSIGYIPQQSVLFTGSIFDNISWGKQDATLEEVKEVARTAQIYDTIESFPEQFNTRVGQKGVNLSGGQKQRLSIARALIRKPAIFIFDDSTSALDVKTEAALWAGLDKEFATKLIVTQKIKTAERAHAIMLLHEGEVVGYGTHDELMKQSALYQKIAQSQSNEEVQLENEPTS